MDARRLQAILSRFPETAILVIGDFFLDRYLILDPALGETSLETGLEAYQVVARRSSPGAAGTVTSNLCGLGVGDVTALGVTGRDGEGFELRQGLAATRVHTACLIESPERFTPAYTKPVIREALGREREINRIDIKNRRPLPAALEDRILAHLDDRLPQVHGVIITDQVPEENCGVITDRVRDALAARAQENPDIVFLADSRVRIGRFRHVILKPNQHESVRAVRPGYDGPVSRSLGETCGQALCRQTRRPVYVTLGEEGMLLITGEGVEHLPGVPVTGEVDPVGAGDSVSAGIAAALCAGATYREAGLIGNLVASITVQQIGTTGTASPEQVLARFIDRTENRS